MRAAAVSHKDDAYVSSQPLFLDDRPATTKRLIVLVRRKDDRGPPHSGCVQFTREMIHGVSEEFSSLSSQKRFTHRKKASLSKEGAGTPNGPFDLLEQIGPSGPLFRQPHARIEIKGWLETQHLSCFVYPNTGLCRVELDLKRRHQLHRFLCF